MPYGPVEVSFDIKQENLSQILEPQPQKFEQSDLDKSVDIVTEDTVVLLSGSAGVQRTLDTLLTRNKMVRRVLYPKQFGALARRKSQEYGIAAEQLNTESLADIGTVDGTQGKFPLQIAGSKGMLLLTSVHYDPMFGLTSSASDLVSLITESKEEAFKRSMEELPCSAERSNASAYSQQLLQSAGEAKVLEIAEKSSTGILSLAYGEPASAHAKMVEYWKNNLRINVPIKSERVLFGCGGQENDRTLTQAFARSFFNIVLGAVLPDSESKICMLAECSEGLGSDALLRFVTGRYEPRTKLDAVTYFDGLEVLLSFFKVQGDLQLSILSTLPNYYASKFDFKTIRGAREAPSSLVQQGSRAKILVVPDGSSSFFVNE